MRGRGRLRIWGILVLLVALLLGAKLTERTPAIEEITSEPFLIPARIGEPVTFRVGTVKVTEISAATELQHLTPPLRTTGIWLIIGLDFTPSTEATTLPALSLEDTEGIRYGGLQAGGTLCGPAQPGFVLNCHVAMELPPDILPGAKLLIPAGHNGLDNPDDIVVVDLGLDAARAQELIASAGPVKLPERIVKGRA